MNKLIKDLRLIHDNFHEHVDLYKRQVIANAIATLSAKPENGCTCPNFNCKVCTYQPAEAKPECKCTELLPSANAWNALWKNHKDCWERHPLYVETSKQLDKDGCQSAWVHLASFVDALIEANKNLMEEKEISNTLSAKPEPAKLPEVEEWLKANTYFSLNTVAQDVVLSERVRTYLQQLTAAHAAALELIQAETAEGLRRMLANWNSDVAEAEAKGRREALQSVPVGALKVSLVGLRALEKDQTVATGDRLQIAYTIADVEKLIESARAAQQENSSGRY